jgi:hypothetical protein
LEGCEALTEVRDSIINRVIRIARKGIYGQTSPGRVTLKPILHKKKIEFREVRVKLPDNIRKRIPDRPKTALIGFWKKPHKKKWIFDWAIWD